MVITKIEQRRKRLCAVYIDDQPVGPVDREILELSGIREGSVITGAQWQELVAESECKRAREKALWLLSHRPHTRHELLEKVGRTISHEAAVSAVERLEELGMVDDADYARRYAFELAERRGYAAQRIERELYRKGIESDLIHEVIEEMALDAAEQIRTLIERKYEKDLLTRDGNGKVVAALQRYGYSWSEIAPCIEQWRADRGEIENEDGAEETGAHGDESHEDRIRYLLEIKYIHSLGSDKDRKRTVNALVARGFSRLQVESVLREVCGLDEE